MCCLDPFGIEAVVFLSLFAWLKNISLCCLQTGFCMFCVLALQVLRLMRPGNVLRVFPPFFCVCAGLFIVLDLNRISWLGGNRINLFLNLWCRWVWWMRPRQPVWGVWEGLEQTFDFGFGRKNSALDLIGYGQNKDWLEKRWRLQ